MQSKLVSKPGNARKPYTVRYWEDDGRQRERSFADKHAAERFQATLTLDQPVAARDDTFGRYAAQWIAQRRTEGTRLKYKSIMNTRLKAFAEMPIAKVAASRAEVTAAVRSASHADGRAMLAILNGTMNESINSGRLTSHRLGGIEPTPAEYRQRRDYFASYAQLRHIADGLDDNGLTVFLMYGCGLRVAEVLALEASDFTSTSVRIERQWQQGKLVPLKHRRAGSFRTVPLPAWLGKLVRAHIRSKGLCSTDPLFTVKYQPYYLRFKELAREAGIERADYSPHFLRHHFASVMLSDGIPITDVSAWLGHRSIEVTYSTYSHLIPDAGNRAREVSQSAWEKFSDSSKIAA